MPATVPVPHSVSDVLKDLVRIIQETMETLSRAVKRDYYYVLLVWHAGEPLHTNDRFHSNAKRERALAKMAEFLAQQGAKPNAKSESFIGLPPESSSSRTSR